MLPNKQINSKLSPSWHQTCAVVMFLYLLIFAIKLHIYINL